MLALSPLVRDGIENDFSLQEIHKEAKYIAESRIEPALYELRKKLELEKGRFWRRIVLQGSSIMPSLLFNWVTKGALTAAIRAVETTKNVALDSIMREEQLENFMSEGGLGYLLDIADHPIFHNENS